MTGEIAAPEARRHAPEARRYGFPAVYGHEVVAVSCVAREDWNSSDPGHVCIIRWRHDAIESRRVPAERMHVWARAGRVSFTDHAGHQTNLTLLGEHEYEGVALGAPWPPTHSPSRAANIAHGVAQDVKNTLTFPSSFPRMMRTSGERNEVLDALVGWVGREMPDTHVLRGWPRSAEGPVGDQIPALPHKGLIGEHGWLETPPGVTPVERERH